MKPVIVKYFREFLIITRADYYSLLFVDIIEVTRSLELTMLSGYKYDALVTTESGKVLCMETDAVYVSFDPSFDPEVTRIIPEGEYWGQNTSKVVRDQGE